tara:strand:+ start:888 stop:1514 length:627 start_codon:yes stop_codon:yes gene_type:complete
MINKLPDMIPIFPLENILFLPKANLPLYIFEERYLNMVNDSIKGNKIIGMVQLKDSKNKIYKEVFNIGCAGKIVFYEKTPDNKILLILNGISRFKIKKEMSLKDGYRRCNIDWDEFKNDFKEKIIEEADKEILLQNIKSNIKTLNFKFFKKQINEIAPNEIIQIIAREFSFSNIENQSIMESINVKSRIGLLIKLLQNSLFSDNKSLH